MTARRKPNRTRPFVGLTLHPDTVALIDARAAEIAGPTGIPSRSAAVDDLVKTATQRLADRRPTGRAG